MKKKVTVLVPTLNAEAELPQLIHSIEEQSLLPNEIIFADSESSDNTRGLIREFGKKTHNCDVQLLSIPRSEFDHGGTRSIMAQKATGDFLVFLTQDAIFANNDSLKSLILFFSSPSMAAVYGRQLPKEGATLFAAHLRLFNYPANSVTKSKADASTFGIKTPFLSNSFCAYRKSALEKIGYFEERLILGEDTIAGCHLLEAGYSLGYCAEAAVFHSHNYTVFEEARRYFDIGVFHKRHEQLLAPYQTSKGEGMAFVKSELRFLKEAKRFDLIPIAFIRNALKLLFYQLGLRHKHIPVAISRRLSMHRGWWKRNLTPFEGGA